MKCKIWEEVELQWPPIQEYRVRNTSSTISILKLQIRAIAVIVKANFLQDDQFNLIKHFYKGEPHQIYFWKIYDTSPLSSLTQ